MSYDDWKTTEPDNLDVTICPDCLKGLHCKGTYGCNCDCRPDEGMQQCKACGAVYLYFCEVPNPKLCPICGAEEELSGLELSDEEALRLMDENEGQNRSE